MPERLALGKRGLPVARQRASEVALAPPGTSRAAPAPPAAARNRRRDIRAALGLSRTSSGGRCFAMPRTLAKDGTVHRLGDPDAEVGPGDIPDASSGST